MQASVWPLQELGWVPRSHQSDLTFKCTAETRQESRGPHLFSSLSPPTPVLQHIQWPHLLMFLNSATSLHLHSLMWPWGTSCLLPGILASSLPCEARGSLLCSQPSLMVPTRVKAQLLLLTTCPLACLPLHLAPSVPATLASLLFLQHSRHTSASGPFCNGCSLCLECYPPRCWHSSSSDFKLYLQMSPARCTSLTTPHHSSWHLSPSVLLYFLLFLNVYVGRGSSITSDD